LGITDLAVELDSLADAARLGEVSYAQVDAIMQKMKAVGFFPEETAVNKVAQAFYGT
jgi:hypothetical protein